MESINDISVNKVENKSTKTVIDFDQAVKSNDTISSWPRGVAPIKLEYLKDSKLKELEANGVSRDQVDDSNIEKGADFNPTEKEKAGTYIEQQVLKLNSNGNSTDNSKTNELKRDAKDKAADRRERRGQNKNRKISHSTDAIQLCRFAAKGNSCPHEKCKFSHDIEAYLKIKEADIGDCCIHFDKTGRCPYGYSCRFLKAHIDDDSKLIVDEEKLKNYEIETLNVMNSNFFADLRKNKYDLSRSEKVNAALDKERKLNQKDKKEDSDANTTINNDNTNDYTYIPLDEPLKEKKLIDFRNKTYLAPLTTVGNLPFRRICKGFGVDITCGEMAMASNLLQGQMTEWSLVRKHRSEDIFGIQLAGSRPDYMVRCADLLNQKVDFDFIDINLGCPIDSVYQNGGGSALMAHTKKLGRMIRGMVSVLDKPLTVKFRTGIHNDKPIAHKLVPQFEQWGCSLGTLHGRSRQQRYTKLADWDYIAQVHATCPNWPMFGNGDVMGYTDYYEQLEHAKVDGIMIGRGALIKPWIFEEIQLRQHLDISSSQRLDMLKQFCDFGLEHWGSDTRGVNHTRRFLCEWQSFLHRYIPVGILEVLPQKINERPPACFGRNDLETKFMSPNVKDWIEISEMFLGKAPEDFIFVPKHKASSYKS